MNSNVLFGYQQPLGAERALAADGAMLRTEQKAEDLLLEVIARYSNWGDIICDLFAGMECAAAGQL